MQAVISDAKIAADEEGDGEHGWLHVYRSTRPLRYVYVDGMSAGKTFIGTLDSQDYLLRRLRNLDPGDWGVEIAPGGPMDEQSRAADLCKLCRVWQVDGVVRMESGFEIIQCDFSDGLEQVQVLQRPPILSDSEGDEFEFFEFVRGISERYQGIGASRTMVDYSSMVSAFFFPVNLDKSGPEPPGSPQVGIRQPGRAPSYRAEARRGDRDRRDLRPAPPRWIGKVFRISLSVDMRTGSCTSWIKFRMPKS